MEELKDSISMEIAKEFSFKPMKEDKITKGPEELITKTSPESPKVKIGKRKTSFDKAPTSLLNRSSKENIVSEEHCETPKSDKKIVSMDKEDDQIIETLTYENTDSIKLITSEIVMESVSEYITDNIKKKAAEKKGKTESAETIKTTTKTEAGFEIFPKFDAKMLGLENVEKSDEQNQIIIYYNKEETGKPSKEKTLTYDDEVTHLHNEENAQSTPTIDFQKCLKQDHSIFLTKCLSNLGQQDQTDTTLDTSDKTKGYMTSSLFMKKPISDRESKDVLASAKETPQEGWKEKTEEHGHVSYIKTLLAHQDDSEPIGKEIGC